MNEPFLLARMPDPPVPADLVVRVMTAIQRARLRQWRNRCMLVLSGFSVGVGYAVVERSSLWDEIRTSSFVEFARLAASDPDVVFSNTKDFVLGLLEALPSGMLLAASFGVFFVIGLAVLADTLLRIRRTSSIHHPFASR